MTYQGIGHLCDHKSLHGHLIEHTLDARQVVDRHVEDRGNDQ